MTTLVSYVPSNLDFGAVRPGDSGPDISVDGSLGPPATSFKGGVQIKSVPVAATLTASIRNNSGAFRVRDIIVLEWTLEDVDPGELPPGHHGRLPKVKVLEVFSQSPGGAPVAVTAGQYVVVRVAYATSFLDSGGLTATLRIEADTWAPIEVPLSLFLAGVATTFMAPPLLITAGKSASMSVRIQSAGGPGPINVSYTVSQTQLHSGLTLEPNSFPLSPGGSIPGTLVFHADPGAPLGPTTLSLDQWDFTRTGLLLPVTILPAAQVEPGVDASIHWAQATAQSLAVDEGRGIWYSGHVNALLPVGQGALLVGTDTGGVWAVMSSGVAIPHSDDWACPDVNCLAIGPDGPNHFYAGTGPNTFQVGSGVALYVSDPASAFLGTMHWNRIPIVDAAGTLLDTGAVQCVVVVARNRRLVLGCAKGMCWANIPPLGQPYTFTPVPLMPVLSYSGLAAGPAGAVIAAGWGDHSVQSGLFYGTWTNEVLLFTRADIQGRFDVMKMQRTSVASCDSAPSNAVAVAGADDAAILAVLRSADGGRHWQVVTTNVPALGRPLESRPPDSPAGLQGNYNNCIAVSAADPNFVVLGWRNGPWISHDMGSTWSLPVNDSNDTHLHSDLHAVLIDPRDAAGRTIYSGNDGGVMVTRDLGATFSDEYNPRLHTLQFTGWGRDDYAAFSASARVPGLFGGGLQDNGNVYAAIESASSGYRQLERSDGNAVLFLSTAQALHYNNVDVAHIAVSRWDGQQLVERNVVPVWGTGPAAIDLSNGLPRAVIAAVATPRYRDAASGKLMLAVAVPKGLGDAYGLFAGDDGSSMHWDYIGSVPLSPKNGEVWAVASLNGNDVYLGTQDGRIHSLSPKSHQWIEFGVGLRATAPGGVWHLSVLRDGFAFATYGTADQRGVLLQSNGFGWFALGSGPDVAAGRGLPVDEGPFYGFDIDRTGATHFLVTNTDTNVYVSRDEGETWLRASTGLPRHAHCTHVRAVGHDDGRRFLYLSTFGRSAWRAGLT